MPKVKTPKGLKYFDYTPKGMKAARDLKEKMSRAGKKNKK